jgi:membrane fusion protein, multidrug efflux system
MIHLRDRASMLPLTVQRIALAILALTALAACGSGEGAEPEPENANGRATNVEVETVVGQPFTEFIRLVGTVEANRDVMVAAEESGVIRAFPVPRGARVQAGQPLARIDDAVLRAQLDQVEAEAELARETYERRRRLFEQDQVGSELNVIEARSRAESAAAQARSLRTRLERTAIRAPIAGTVESREVEVGSTVSPGTPVARIVDLSVVKVTAGVPERFAADLGVGDEVRVGIGERGRAEHTGRLAFVGLAVAERGRTFPIEVEIRDPEAGLRPGMTANLRLPRRVIADAILIPQAAMLRDEGGFFVYVVEERGGEQVAVRREVMAGATEGGRVLVEAGLQPGERVVVVGQQRVAHGDRVRLVGGGAE